MGVCLYGVHFVHLFLYLVLSLLEIPKIVNNTMTESFTEINQEQWINLIKPHLDLTLNFLLTLVPRSPSNPNNTVMAGLDLRVEPIECLNKLVIFTFLS